MSSRLPVRRLAQCTAFVIHSGTQIQNVTQAIAMPTQIVEDSTLAYGTDAILQQGSPGQEVVTYQLNLQNNVVVGRTELQAVVISQPVTEIVAQGTNLSGIKGDMALAGIAPVIINTPTYIITHESGWCTDKLQGDIGYCPVSPPVTNLMTWATDYARLPQAIRWPVPAPDWEPIRLPS